jgi:hypothetical protein
MPNAAAGTSSYSFDLDDVVPSIVAPSKASLRGA